MQPLILTLALDKENQAYFDEMRKKYFPPERNFLDAHLTLFHHLPAGERAIVDVLERASTNQQVMNLEVAEVRSIGNGVAYKIESLALMQLHKYLQQEWEQWLIPQDRQKLWPHITVQNKAEPAMASALLARLKQEFSPFTMKGEGLNLWEYLGGPWSFIQTYPFKP